MPTLSMIYWVIIVVSILVGFFGYRSLPAGVDRGTYIGGSLVTLALFIILGLRVFGGVH